MFDMSAAADPASLSAAIELLLDAEQPLIVAGNGCTDVAASVPILLAPV